MWNDFLKTEMHFFLSYIVITLIEIDNAYWFFFMLFILLLFCNSEFTRTCPACKTILRAGFGKVESRDLCFHMTFKSGHVTAGPDYNIIK